MEEAEESRERDSRESDQQLKREEMLGQVVRTQEEEKTANRIKANKKQEKNAAEKEKEKRESVTFCCLPESHLISKYSALRAEGSVC
jgi:hypothetical protein